MPRSGTLVVATQNLDYSGANMTVYNILAGRMHESNVVVLSPVIGVFAARFIDSGAAVRIGDVESLLHDIRDVFCVISNTIMTANIVVDMAKRPVPVVWILHEWWDDKMIVENLAIRNLQGLTLSCVKEALSKAAMIVFVCEAQRQLYKPAAPSTVIYVGVPRPLTHSSLNYTPELATGAGSLRPFVFLVLGIVCPRKNQMWAVELFKKFCDRAPPGFQARLQIVGARRTRTYEIEYLDKLLKLIGSDKRVEVVDVTEHVERYYESVDCLLFTSVNEVTPMVIMEAMSYGLPVLSTNIAGIPEMIEDGVEGRLFSPGDSETALACMREVAFDATTRKRMGDAGVARFSRMFELDIMVSRYRQLVLSVAPPVILLDMDGTIVDWDCGFRAAWAGRSSIDREASYYMERCVPSEFREEAELLTLSEGFFESLPPMEGALNAIGEMEREGLKLFLCTSPILISKYCAQEKLNWVRSHLGEPWLDKVIMCHDKTAVRGDLLIDDKPFEFLSPLGRHTLAAWRQVIFDAPYNRQKDIPRLYHWANWRDDILPLLGKKPEVDPYMREFDEPISSKISRMSPKYNKKRVLALSQAKAKAQQLQDMCLGPASGEMTPEDVASVKGTASLLVEDVDLAATEANPPSAGYEASYAEPPKLVANPLAAFAQKLLLKNSTAAVGVPAPVMPMDRQLVGGLSGKPVPKRSQLLRPSQTDLLVHHNQHAPSLPSLDKEHSDGNRGGDGEECSSQRMGTVISPRIREGYAAWRGAASKSPNNKMSG